MQILLIFLAVAFAIGVRGADPRRRSPLLALLVLSLVVGASYYYLRFI